MLEGVPSLSRLSAAWCVLALAACATPRMHTEEELNIASLGCGLTFGELIQDEEAKKQLIVLHAAPSQEQRSCAYHWARKNHMRLVIVENIQFPEAGQ